MLRDFVLELFEYKFFPHFIIYVVFIEQEVTKE